MEREITVYITIRGESLQLIEWTETKLIESLKDTPFIENVKVVGLGRLKAETR